MMNNRGKTIRVKELCDKYENSFTNKYVSRNVKAALNCLENQDKLVVEGRKKAYVQGKKTMPDTALVTFKQ